MPYLCRDGKINFLPQAQKSDRFPLGIVPTTIYEQMSMKLQSGDILILYTDGIVDAMNGNAESYGFDRFSESIKELTAKSADEMIEHLIKGVYTYRGNGQVDDDVTVVILKIT